MHITLLSMISASLLASSMVRLQFISSHMRKMTFTTPQAPISVTAFSRAVTALNARTIRKTILVSFYWTGSITITLHRISEWLHSTASLRTVRRSTVVCSNGDHAMYSKSAQSLTNQFAIQLKQLSMASLPTSLLWLSVRLLLL